MTRLNTKLMTGWEDFHPVIFFCETSVTHQINLLQ